MSVVNVVLGFIIGFGLGFIWGRFGDIMREFFNQARKRGLR